MYKIKISQHIFSFQSQSYVMKKKKQVPNQCLYQKTKPSPLRAICTVKIPDHTRKKFPTHTKDKPAQPKNPPSTPTAHLWPIVSLCFCRARSMRDWEANWTKASPVVRPSWSVRIVIPFGTISNPVNPTQKQKFRSHSQQPKNREFCTQNFKSQLLQSHDFQLKLLFLNSSVLPQTDENY